MYWMLCKEHAAFTYWCMNVIRFFFLQPGSSLPGPGNNNRFRSLLLMRTPQPGHFLSRFWDQNWWSFIRIWTYNLLRKPMRNYHSVIWTRNNLSLYYEKKDSFLTWNKTLNIELHFSSLLKTNIPYGNFTPNSPFQHPIFTHLHWRLLSNIWSSIHDHRQTGMAPWLHSHIYSKCNLIQIHNFNIKFPPLNNTSNLF